MSDQWRKICKHSQEEKEVEEEERWEEEEGGHPHTPSVSWSKFNEDTALPGVHSLPLSVLPLQFRLSYLKVLHSFLPIHELLVCMWKHYLYCYYTTSCNAV